MFNNQKHIKGQGAVKNTINRFESYTFEPEEEDLDVQTKVSFLEVFPKTIVNEENDNSHIVYKFKKEEPFTINKIDNVWTIRGEKVEKLLKMTKFNTDESALNFAFKLKKMGIDDKLRELGANEGDTVRILDFEFEYSENEDI